MNEWKKKWVVLQRTWVSKRTVEHNTLLHRVIQLDLKISTHETIHYYGFPLNYSSSISVAFLINPFYRINNYRNVNTENVSVLLLQSQHIFAFLYFRKCCFTGNLIGLKPFKLYLNLRMRFDIEQINIMFKITHGPLEFPMASFFAQRATRPRLQVPPTAMLYAPSPIRLQNSDCPILEQTAGWDGQRILGEIFQDTPGCPLSAPVPRSTHLPHLLSQPFLSAHIDHVKNSHPRDPSHHTWSFIVVFAASYANKNDMIWYNQPSGCLQICLRTYMV